MELKDTIQMMNSSDYKERFKAEYYQLKIRRYKLFDIYRKNIRGELDFTLDCSKDILSRQLCAMSDYLLILEQRAEIEGIEL